MAIPTSAAARAGASFTPSPAMATRRPSARNATIRARLSSGKTPARTSSIPKGPATARAVRSLSPVAMMMRKPCACSALIAAAVLSRTGSATATIPASAPSTATNIAVLPVARRVSACASAAVVASPRSCIIAALPSATLRPPTVP